MLGTELQVEECLGQSTNLSASPAPVLPSEAF